jgi:hypothetical protein
VIDLSSSDRFDGTTAKNFLTWGDDITLAIADTEAPAGRTGGLTAYFSGYIATNFLGHGTVNPKTNESDD